MDNVVESQEKVYEGEGWRFFSRRGGGVRGELREGMKGEEILRVVQGEEGRGS